MANQFNILDYTDGPLLKTGQTTDYTPAGRTTKDDGGFQRGIAGSKADEQYNILTTGQYSGTSNITVNGFTDTHSNEAVNDKVSGLMWSRNENPAIYGAGTDDLFWDDTAGSNEDIFEYCDQANIANLSGFTDWRVPNSVELLSLLLLSGISPAINSTAFPSITNTVFWSSTTSFSVATSAYEVRFNNGQTRTAIKMLDVNKVLLCRLGIE